MRVVGYRYEPEGWRSYACYVSAAEARAIRERAADAANARETGPTSPTAEEVREAATRVLNGPPTGYARHGLLDVREVED